MNDDERIWYELGIIIGKKEYKDKIKAKIEEVNIKLENYEADKINIFSGQTYMEKFKLLGELYGLQSLLEKRSKTNE